MLDIVKPGSTPQSTLLDIPHIEGYQLLFLVTVLFIIQEPPLRNLSIFLFQAMFIHLYELCIYMLYIFVKGMLQVI